MYLNLACSTHFGLYTVDTLGTNKPPHTKTTDMLDHMLISSLSSTVLLPLPFLVLSCSVFWTLDSGFKGCDKRILLLISVCLHLYSSIPQHTVKGVFLQGMWALSMLGDVMLRGALKCLEKVTPGLQRCSCGFDIAGKLLHPSDWQLWSLRHRSASSQRVQQVVFTLSTFSGRASGSEMCLNSS